ncbi:unnamed protein product [Pleuronectes platessa]|uniref:Uncharacterized protein n=1 Tax=Pleuronectes platessa TaxID=8262 RepID=A0A9N7VK08_PLEPL|nr:unnamed protein product [Pleuronectes platessa]
MTQLITEQLRPEKLCVLLFFYKVTDRLLNMNELWSHCVCRSEQLSVFTRAPRPCPLIGEPGTRRSQHWQDGAGGTPPSSLILTLRKPMEGYFNKVWKKPSSSHCLALSVLSVPSESAQRAGRKLSQVGFLSKWERKCSNRE